MTKEAEQRKTAAIYRKAARCGNCFYAAFKPTKLHCNKLAAPINRDCICDLYKVIPKEPIK